MATTPRFGLEYFGGDTEGSLDGNGGKFTRGDRLVLDRLLAAFETHDHGGGSQLSDPTAAPTLTLDTAAGELASGQTYYYVLTYIDQYGLESAASSEASVTTPAAVLAPQGPGLVTEAGGTLATGLYMYALTAHKGAGETTMSTFATITVSDLTTVRVSIPGGMPTGADNISIWRQGPTETWFTRVQTQATAADWVDDGTVPANPSACEPANQPPTENTTESTNQVVIDTPAGDLTDPSLASRWRIYRSTTAGVYGPSSLVADISDTTTEGGTQLVETYTDDGSVPLASGSPPASTRALIPSSTLPLQVEANATATSYTLVLADAFKYLRFTDAGNVALTVPTDASVAFSIGTVVEVHAAGAGGVTVAGDVGVTVNGADTVGEHETATLVKIDTDEWDMVLPTGDGGGALTVENNAASGTYTFVLADAFKYVRFTDAGNVAATVPTNASVAYEVGTIIQIYGVGVGGVTVAGDSGVTVNNAGTVGQGTTGSIVKVATDEWDMILPASGGGGGGGGDFELLAAGELGTGTTITNHTTIDKIGGTLAFTVPSGGARVELRAGFYGYGNTNADACIAVSNDSWTTEIIFDPYSVPTEMVAGGKVRMTSASLWGDYPAAVIADLTAGSWEVAWWHNDTSTLNMADYGSPAFVYRIG